MRWHLGAEEDASKVYVNDGLPVLELHAEYERVARDAGVVDEHRDGLVEVCLHVLEHLLHLRGV
jgi:hypothetical protein